MEATKSFDSNQYPAPGHQIDANTLFGRGVSDNPSRPTLLPQRNQSPVAEQGNKPFASEDFIELDELLDSGLYFSSEDHLENETNPGQPKSGLLVSARGLRANFREMGLRTGEALMVAKIDLPARHEHATLKDTAKATVKSVGSSTGNIFNQALLQNSAGEVVRGIKKDVGGSEHKWRLAGLTAAVGVTEAADRMRVMLLTIPHYSTEVLTNTQSPTKAGLVGAGIYTLWNLISSEVLTQGLNQLPETKSRIKEEYPAAVQLFRDSLPGANKEVAAVEKEKSKEKGVLRKMGGFLLRHGARGGTGVAIGTTAFVATSALDGDSVSETRKQYLGVTIDTAGVTWLTVAGICQAITEMPKHGMANQADWLYNRVTDMKTWYLLAGLSIGQSYMASRKIKKEISALGSDKIPNPDALDSSPELVVPAPVIKHKYYNMRQRGAARLEVASDMEIE